MVVTSDNSDGSIKDGDVSSPEVLVKKNKRKIRNFIRRGVAIIKATFNNTRVTITDKVGNVLCWSTAGKAKFKGSGKNSSYAAQVIANEAAKKANQTFGMSEVEVLINGPGAGRESAVRGIVAAGLEVLLIRDVTPIPHNGCRPPKRRRM